MKSKLLLMALLALAIALLAACGGSGQTASSAVPAGNVANGEKLFNSATIGSNSAPGCVTCHSLQEGVVVVGPSQSGLAERAGNRVAGQSAAEYLHESIVNPNAYVVDGFAEGVMYQNYGTDLTPEQIDDLVAYLETLK